MTYKPLFMLYSRGLFIMSKRFEMLAGLVSEDDFDTVRTELSEEYHKIVNEDVKEYSEHFRVLEEDEDRLNKMLDIEESHEWVGDKQETIKENDSVTMGGYAFGFDSKPHHYDPFVSKDTQEIMNQWNRYAGMAEMKEPADLPGELEDRDDDFLSMDKMNALEALSGGGDELIRHNIDLQRDLKMQNLIQKTDGQWTITDKAKQMLGLSEAAWKGRRMSNGSLFTDFREDHYDEGDVPQMHVRNPEFPNEWQFYENDPTYMKIVDKLDDSLDDDEYSEEADEFHKFVSQYDANKNA